MDYHILQTTKDEYFIRQVRNGMDAAGIPVEFSKGEFGRGQEEINLATRRRWRWPTGTRCTRTASRRSRRPAVGAVTFMAKWSMAEAGSSFHLHSSVWDAAGGVADGERGRAAPAVADVRGTGLGGLWDRSGDGMDVRAVGELLQAVPAGSWAPTAIAWGHDNRTCGFRVVGEHEGFRVEWRIPGADGNPYLAFAATIAAGTVGDRERCRAPRDVRGQRVRSAGRPAGADIAARGDRRVRRLLAWPEGHSATTCSSIC